MTRIIARAGLILTVTAMALCAPSSGQEPSQYALCMQNCLGDIARRPASASKAQQCERACEIFKKEEQMRRECAADRGCAQQMR
jgi:hypothetical protein